MHTWDPTQTYKDNYGNELEIWIHHNGDFSGDAKINIRPKGQHGNEKQIIMPCQALVDFNRAAVLQQVIAQIENM
jgi:hypothetical protein